MSTTEQKALAAVATLEHLGYTYLGGDQWKPPLGKAPDFVSVDYWRGQAETLRAQVEALTKPQEPVAWLYHDAPTLEDCLDNERRGFPVNSVLLTIRQRAGMRNETPLYTHPTPSPLTRPAVPEGWKLVPDGTTEEMSNQGLNMGQVHIGTLDAIDESWDVDGEIFPLTGWEIRQLSCMARKYLESIAAAPQPGARPTEQSAESYADKYPVPHGYTLVKIGSNPARLTKTQASTIRDMALALEKTGRIVSLSEGNERAHYVQRNREIQCALEDFLNQLAEAQPTEAAQKGGE